MATCQNSCEIFLQGRIKGIGLLINLKVVWSHPKEPLSATKNKLSGADKSPVFDVLSFLICSKLTPS